MIVPMSTTPAQATSQRLLMLLSLLQTHREWSGAQLAQRLRVTDRTVRRDVDRLRELDYTIHAVRGPAGGYRLEAGTRMPPLLFDDDQVLAIAVALRSAGETGAGIEEAAARALTTMRQVMPTKLRARWDGLEFAVGRPARGPRVQVDTAVLTAISTAVRARSELRFDYVPAGGADRADGADQDAGVLGADPSRGPRRAQPHHLVLRLGFWYVVAWDTDRADWRTFRADRMRIRVPGGPRFTRRELPGGNVTAFLAARFKGSTTDVWPCLGDVIMERPAADIAAYASDAEIEPLDGNRCRVRIGAWSWPGLAASLARFDADLEVLDPPELSAAFADLARRAARAAGRPDGADPPGS